MLFENYSRDDILTELLPYKIKLTYDSSEYQSKWQELSNWLKHNTKNRVHLTTIRTTDRKSIFKLNFEDANDYMLFKLSWIGEN